MAVPVVADYLAGSADATSPISVTVPSGWSAGDLVFALLHSFVRSITSAPSGWTGLDSPQYSGAVRSYLYWKILGSGDPGSTLDWATNADPSYGRAVLVKVTGHDTTTPINVSAGQADTATNSHASPSVTTTASDCLILRFLCIDENNSGWSASSGDTGTNVATSTVMPTYTVWKSSLASAGATGTGTYGTSNVAMQLFTVAVAPSAGGVAKPVLFHSHFRSQGW
jgi:hypothetical protein